MTLADAIADFNTANAALSTARSTYISSVAAFRTARIARDTASDSVGAAEDNVLYALQVVLLYVGIEAGGASALPPGSTTPTKPPPKRASRKKVK